MSTTRRVRSYYVPRLFYIAVNVESYAKEHFVFVWKKQLFSSTFTGGGPRVVVSTAAFHARVRGSVPGLGGLKETKIVSSPSTCES